MQAEKNEKLDFQAIEKKWQQRWEKEGVFKVKEDTKKKKFYVLEMFPYPSAAGLHMGHIRNYAMGDTFARFKRMQGFNVLYPVGYDAFGLPAENAAIKSKTHPRGYTENAIAGIRKNQKALGLSYDWTRELATCYPDYYKWNQWFFLQMLKKGLAYKKEASVNWCPKCETVLANEQVEQGKCWRCSSEVTDKSIEQWFLKITDYADDLLSGLEKLGGWPERIRTMQRNWIGKSRGVDIYFKLEGSDKILSTFTTRCDTIFSVTFLGIAPEHPLIAELVKGMKHEKGAKGFVARMKKQSIADRMNEEKEKEGFFTGRYAINPVNGERVPIYIANFAVMYGSGIVMCNAHDKRDFRFARKYGIPLKFVISKDGKPIDPKGYDDAFTDDGILFNSGEFSGMKNNDALPEMAEWLDKSKFGKKAVNYKLRDWGISRQRYWGTPIPVVYCSKCGALPHKRQADHDTKCHESIVPVPEKELPVLLPADVKFTGHGNPLASSEKFIRTKCPKCGGAARRETDTMDTFIDSSWYFLRYCSPDEKDFAFDKKAVKYWMPVDQYIGGAEHAVMHLLYARFFVKVLRDLGLVDFDEPFTRLFNQGIVYKDGHKMSKSFGNVVTQDEISKKYGMDTARIFLLFIASPDSQLEWSDEGIVGSYRFVLRFLGMAKGYKKVKCRLGKPETKDLMMRAKLHSAIKKVTESMDSFRFNMSIGELMGLSNEIQKYAENPHKDVFAESMKTLIILLSPFAPHVCEEVWELLAQQRGMPAKGSSIAGNRGFVSLEKWPRHDETLIDRKLEMTEELAEGAKEDIKEVIKIVGKQPKGIIIYIAPLWKYSIYNEIIERAKGEGEIKNTLKSIMQIPEARSRGRHAAMFAEKLARDARMLKGVLSQEEELKTFDESRKEFEKLFGCSIRIMKAEGSSSLKALRAEPGKPGIEVEV